MEIVKIVKSHGKWKYTIIITFWPNIKFDISKYSDARATRPFACTSLDTKRSWNFLI